MFQLIHCRWSPLPSPFLQPPFHSKPACAALCVLVCVCVYLYPDDLADLCWFVRQQWAQYGREGQVGGPKRFPVVRKAQQQQQQQHDRQPHSVRFKPTITATYCRSRSWSRSQSLSRYFRPDFGLATSAPASLSSSSSSSLGRSRPENLQTRLCHSASRRARTDICRMRLCLLCCCCWASRRCEASWNCDSHRVRVRVESSSDVVVVVANAVRKN